MKIVERVKRMRPRTWIIAGAAAVVIVGGGTTWAVLATTASSASATAQAPTTQSVAASLETLEQTVDASGTLTPTVQEDVDFAVSGTVTAVSVQAGQTVAAGDTLATVDTLTVQAAALEAAAALAKAQATLASAEADDDGSDESTTQIAADAAAVAVAQAAADEAAAAVADATLVAPVAGLVTAVNLEVGDAVTGSGSSSSSSSSSSGSGSGTGSTGAGTGATGSTGSSTSSAAFTIVSTDSWQVSLSIGETDVANVAVGDQVELSTDDGTAIFGTVSEVGLLPSMSSGAAAYPVTVAITGSPEGLYDGTAVTASIVYERRTEVLTVPSGAVTTDADGVSTVTAVDADGNTSTVEVTVGETVGTLTEITAGLAEGDLVQVTVFTGGAGTSGTGDTRTGTGGMGGFGGDGTGTFPGGGTLPEGFDPSQMGGMPGQTGGN